MSKRSNSILGTHDEVLASLALLGQRIHAHRVAQGWTIKDMAERLFCSQNTYRAIEAGKPTASIGIIANVLWLFGQIDSLNHLAPLPYPATAAKRVRKPGSQAAPGTISEDEREF
ncbi:helix-turn-helix domain-containing protein [Methylobacillus arboreus]|uniref:helix-turn-helix domain-containing protein n=1 Tax=Methylobacillus arboreus TaxID=755170 RepID=UPI001E2E6CDE|nr:helix-turn-helix domain-containing protein [Methylobacillus arboreus]MCB5189359.1 helix-turn-helix domain-containing protein [Methylobacillus arboreus]